MPSDIAERRRVFRALHLSGCFVIPNPWDAGSARYLQHLGFKALATTSSGCAWSLGLPDNAVGLEAMLAHLGAIVPATELPVNADFENGYADEPAEVADNVARAVETGVAGLSIEDLTGRSERPLYDLALAVERVKAARRAIDQSKSGLLLTARAECFLVGHPDPLKESLRRLQAYAEAGADCLYAPGVKTPEQIAAVVKAVAPKPVNVLTVVPDMPVSKYVELGVRRISVGGALARAAWGEFMRVAKEISSTGSFAGFSRAAPFAEVNGFFADEAKKRK